jgi:eukaryotic translation initiation factor 2C
MVKDRAVDLLLIILPDDAAALRKAVKHWGDAIRGIPTQCVVRVSPFPEKPIHLTFSQKAGKAKTANDQYNNNLILK